MDDRLFVWPLSNSIAKSGPPLRKGKIFKTSDFPTGAVDKWVKDRAAKYVDENAGKPVIMMKRAIPQSLSKKNIARSERIRLRIKESKKRYDIKEKRVELLLRNRTFLEESSQHPTWAKGHT